MNSARARRMSKPCATSTTRLTPSLSSRAAENCAFSCVLRERSSVQRTGTPNSRSSVSRITSASVRVLRRAPPVTSTGKPVARATSAP